VRPSAVGKAASWGGRAAAVVVGTAAVVVVAAAAVEVVVFTPAPVVVVPEASSPQAQSRSKRAADRAIHRFMALLRSGGVARPGFARGPVSRGGNGHDPNISRSWITA
jgi:hypothetical protein